MALSISNFREGLILRSFGSFSGFGRCGPVVILLVLPVSHFELLIMVKELA